MPEALHNEALAAVLGACFLVIGLCSFATVILLIQHYQKTKAAPATPVLVPHRQVSAPKAMTTQYRPLSESSLRLRGDQPSARALSCSGGRLAGQPGSFSDQPLGVSGTSTSPASNLVSMSPRIGGPKDCALVRNSVVAAPASPLRLGSPTSSSGGNRDVAAAAPVDEPGIDIALLSRIDQALSSGTMKPEDADLLLKSFGCDLEELFREELDRSAAASICTATGVPLVPQRPSRMSSAVPSGASGTTQHTKSFRSANTATPATPPAGPPLDDEMLLRIDRALSSGVMRPYQAEQLLKSYGCDLEELMREELGGGPSGHVSVSGSHGDSGSAGLLR